MTLPLCVRLRWKHHYRIIPTRVPFIDLYESIDLSEKEKRHLWALQARINPSQAMAAGQMSKIREGDMLHGPHASIVNGAFAHTRRPSRFSDGRIGVYYAARARETAIRETVYHAQRYAIERQDPARDMPMRVWIGKIKQSCYDVRDKHYIGLHTPDSYHAGQAFAYGLLQKDPNAYGLVYNSVRHLGGECLAVFRPPMVTCPIQGAHLLYRWNGHKITEVVEKIDPILTFE